MTDTDRVTAGPWRVESVPADPCYAEISGAPVVQEPMKPFKPHSWSAFATVVVKMADEDEPSAEGLANLNLILSAVNACFQVSPTNPSAVAAEIGEAFDLLKELEYAITQEVNEKGGGGYILARLSETRELLSRIHSKSKGGQEQ